MFVSSILFAVSAISAIGFSYSDATTRSRNLTVSYVAALAFTLLLTLSVFFHLTPLFFVQGVGPTVLRQIILGVGTVLFVACGFMFLRLYLISWNTVLYWYSLGLILVAIGLVSVFSARAVGSELAWAGRLAQYMGCIYLLISVLSAKPRGTQAEAIAKLSI